MSNRRTLGLTLTEALIATGIVATLAAIAVPNLLDARKGANESSAISTLNILAASQTSYHSVAGVYAGNFQTLIDTAFLSAMFFPTSLGTRSGYVFTLCATPPCDPPGASPPTGSDGSAYKILAVPASVATANRVFTEDDSGLILAVVGAIPAPTDEVVEPASGPTSACLTGCVTLTPPPMPSQLEIDSYQDALEALATGPGITGLDALAPEDVISLAVNLFPSSVEWEVILNELDADVSSSLDWNEILTPDLLAAARNIKTTIPGSDPGPSIGPDVNLTNITQNYQSDLTTLLALGTADEEATPPIVIARATGDPVALLMSLLSAVPGLGWLAASVLAAALLVVGVSVRGRVA
jgi:type II secretory pathway pseudopilin PulG